MLMQGREPIVALDEIPVAGLHNAANALAAHALMRASGIEREPLARAIREFRGLPHRAERVTAARGVTFYDDSKGTNVGATVAALDGLAGSAIRQGARVVLIAGGEGKSQDFSPLRPAVARTARAAVLIGRDAESIALALEGSGVPVRRAGTMEHAVELSAAEAWPGDAVLLSPACASFDMFRDYKHRGEVYCDAVKRLIDATAS
jgi:UDP-N-acetylmuramoylalanine--D-glutamate ligase